MENKPMTKNSRSDENKPLKQRLLGAAVLVALAVIIIPELVKKPVPQTQVTTVDIPSKPALTLKLNPPEPQPLPPSSPPEALDELTPPQQAVIDNSILESSATSSAPELVATAEDAAPTDMPATSTSLTDTVVPMPATPRAQSAATPAVTANAGNERPRTSTPTPDTARSSVSPAAAGRTPSQNTSSGQQSRQVALPKIELISPRQYPHNSAQYSQRPIAAGNAPSQTVLADNSSNANNWVVQAGSFAVASNANLLRDQLRARDFPASLRTVNVDGRTLYRVNVGPYTSRTAGEQARQRLLREASVNGSVRPM